MNYYDIDENRITKWPIMETFYSIQGEGTFSGFAAYFIRLAGCDIGCHWCDVKDSWNFNKYKFINLDKIISEIDSKVRIIVITGGEPFIWDITNLTIALKNKGYSIHIETSGAYKMSGIIDWICLSPKKRKLPINEIYSKANELKIIVHNSNDLRFAEIQASKVKKSCKLILQPEWSKLKEIVPTMINYIQINTMWKISLQTHKYLNLK